MRLRLSFSVLCDYNASNIRHIQSWLDKNCKGHHHLCYTRESMHLPQILFQYKQDAKNFESWLNNTHTLQLTQQYMKDCIANGIKWREYAWR
jgi:hypothetical protein